MSYYLLPNVWEINSNNSKLIHDLKKIENIDLKWWKFLIENSGSHNIGSFRNALYELSSKIKDEGDIKINLDNDDFYTKSYTKIIIQNILANNLQLVFGGMTQKVNIHLNGNCFFFLIFVIKVF